jgi:hypothetical protein
MAKYELKVAFHPGFVKWKARPACLRGMTGPIKGADQPRNEGLGYPEIFSRRTPVGRLPVSKNSRTTRRACAIGIRLRRAILLRWLPKR